MICQTYLERKNLWRGIIEITTELESSNYEPLIKVALRSILQWTKFPDNISKLFVNIKNATNIFRSHCNSRQRQQRYLNGP